MHKADGAGARVGGVSFRLVAGTGALLSLIVLAMLLLTSWNLSGEQAQDAQLASACTQAERAVTQLQTHATRLHTLSTLALTQQEVAQDKAYISAYYLLVDEAWQQAEQAAADMPNEATRSCFLKARDALRRIYILEGQAMYVHVISQDRSPASRDPALVYVPQEIAWEGLPAKTQKTLSQAMLGSDTYFDYDSLFQSYLSACLTQIDICRDSRDDSSFARLLHWQQVLLVLLLVLLVLTFGSMVLLAMVPLGTAALAVAGRQTVPSSGCKELRQIGQAYNDLLMADYGVGDRLRLEGSRDKLTGLLDFACFQVYYKAHEGHPMTMVLADIDHMTAVNEQYGLDTGDRLIQKLAGVCMTAFRRKDFVFRMRSDVIAVVLPDVASEVMALLEQRIDLVFDLQAEDTPPLPPVTISMGVAFTDLPGVTGDLFKDAEGALYQAKHTGGNCCIYAGLAFPKKDELATHDLSEPEPETRSEPELETRPEPETQPETHPEPETQPETANT